MKKLLAYPLSVIYYLVFGLILLIFHPIQIICLRVFGYQAHKKSVDYLNFFLTRSLHLLGFTYSFKLPKNIPNNRPVIIVANHQSLNDIPPIIWFMRKFHVKFISKIELGKGIPSVSYNLRHGGSVLINRKDPKQAIVQIAKMAKYIEQHNRAVVIFPEGTRSKTGQPKAFQTTGLSVLLKKAPNAIVIPITINNSWRSFMYGKFPLGIGYKITFTVHPHIENKDYKPQELIPILEKTITQAII